MIDFDKLKAEALASPKKRSRYFIEPGFDMVICLHRDSYVRMHRHPQYEAYHVLEGQLSMASDGLNRTVWFDLKNPYVRISPMKWHQPMARTKFVIYREFYCGPFDKARDVEYAPWAEKEAA